MIKVQYLDKYKTTLLKRDISFLEMLQDVANCIVKDEKNCKDTVYAKYTYKEITILIYSIDDLIPEFNIDAFRIYPELKEELKSFYPDQPVEFYVDIKNELANFVSNNLKSLSLTSKENTIEHHRLGGLQSITFGEGNNEEVYSVDSNPLGYNYDVYVSATNLDVDRLMITLLPEHSSKYARYNFRPVVELTDYIITIFGNTHSILNCIILVSYSKHFRNF